MVKGRIVEALLVACVAMAAGCSTPTTRPVVGGLSAAALLLDLAKRGEPFHDNSGVFGGGARTLLLARNPSGIDLVSLAVAPVHLGDKVKWVDFGRWLRLRVLPDRYATDLVFPPVLTHGDGADVYRRITGKEHPTLKGELSEEYKAFLEGKGR